MKEIRILENVRGVYTDGLREGRRYRIGEEEETKERRKRERDRMDGKDGEMTIKEGGEERK